MTQNGAGGDYQAVKDLHVEAGMLDAYDAAVVARNEKGKVKITKEHETPTRVGGVLGGGIGLATGRSPSSRSPASAPLCSPAPPAARCSERSPAMPPRA